MKSLTLNWTTAGWRFMHAPIFSTNFVEQWKLIQDVALRNLDEFYNLNAASGAWLDMIGNIFNLRRPYGINGNQFVLNLDRLNDPSVVLNGYPESVSDQIYRILIQMRAASKNKLFTMKNIAEMITTVLGADQVIVQFRENTDVLGNYVPRYFRILLTFKESLTAKIFLGLVEMNPDLLGKPMGYHYDIYCNWDPDADYGTEGGGLARINIRQQRR